MGVNGPTALDRGGLLAAAELLDTLGHPARIRMVQMPVDREYTVGELAEARRPPGHTASGHLRRMRRCGFLTRRREGGRRYYQVAVPCLRLLMACVEHRFGRHEPSVFRPRRPPRIVGVVVTSIWLLYRTCKARRPIFSASYRYSVGLHSHLESEIKEIERCPDPRRS